MTGPEPWSAAIACAELRAGTVTAERLALRCLDAMASLEPAVRAFTWCDRERALERARAADRACPTPLLGLPVAVKDIIDTAGIPTERGSPVFAGRTPERSAAVVRALEDVGGVMVGKTVTAELAFATPGPTRNPWDRTRTPGGSSMGSAAAVAAGMVPAALGTQTNSSVIMPAALCGVAGFKPTGGLTTTDGVMAFSPTLDELGCFGATAADVTLVAPVLGAGLRAVGGARASVAGLRVGVARGAGWPAAVPAVEDRVARAVEGLVAYGALVTAMAPPADAERARVVHRTIMAFEAARELGAAVLARPDVVSEILLRFLEYGRGLGSDEHAAALRERDGMIEAFDRALDAVDVIALPAAPDEAPARTGTGDPRFCTLWTLVGAPALTLPCGRGPQGLPIGVQLVAARGHDAELLAAGRAIESSASLPSACRLEPGSGA